MVCYVYTKLRGREPVTEQPRSAHESGRPDSICVLCDKFYFIVKFVEKCYTIREPCGMNQVVGDGDFGRSSNLWGV